MSCGMRQRIPTLNLNLILNPKLDLISKLITVALLPTRPRDPIYTQRSTHTGMSSTWAAMDSGSGITGGGSEYAALLAHGRSSVRYGTRLGDLEENWLLLFSN